GSSFTRLVSVVETTNPLGLEYPRPTFPTPEEVRLGGTGSGDNDDGEQAPIDLTLVRGQTILSLTAESSVIEGESITYTATVNNVVTGAPLVVTLTNGSIITIPVGQNSASVTIDSRADDVYLQGDDPLTVGIGGTTGGNYENLNTGSTTTTVVKDDADATTITLSSPGTIVEGQAFTVTATVNNAVTGRDLVIELSNGQFIT